MKKDRVRVLSAVILLSCMGGAYAMDDDMAHAIQLSFDDNNAGREQEQLQQAAAESVLAEQLRAKRKKEEDEHELAQVYAESVLAEQRRAADHAELEKVCAASELDARMIQQRRDAAINNIVYPYVDTKKYKDWNIVQLRTANLVGPHGPVITLVAGAQNMQKGDYFYVDDQDWLNTICRNLSEKHMIMSDILDAMQSDSLPADCVALVGDPLTIHPDDCKKEACSSYAYESFIKKLVNTTGNCKETCIISEGDSSAAITIERQNKQWSLYIVSQANCINDQWLRIQRVIDDVMQGASFMAGLFELEKGNEHVAGNLYPTVEEKIYLVPQSAIPVEQPAAQQVAPQKQSGWFSCPTVTKGRLIAVTGLVAAASYALIWDVLLEALT